MQKLIYRYLQHILCYKILPRGRVYIRRYIKRELGSSLLRAMSKTLKILVFFAHLKSVKLTDEFKIALE